MKAWPSENQAWQVKCTGVGERLHFGPIELDPSGSLILYDDLDDGPTEIFGPGMWVRASKVDC